MEELRKARGGRGLTRRGFLRGLTAGSGVVILGSTAGMATLAGCPSDTPLTSYTTEQLQTMQALMDTVIPGYSWWGYVGDDQGYGGAIDAGAWNIFWDVYYGFNGWIDDVTSDLGSGFKTGTLAQRSWRLQDCLNGNTGPWYASGSFVPAYQGAILLAKLAYFGGLVNNVGTNYIGFPGPSAGY